MLATRSWLSSINLDVIKTADWLIDLGPEGVAAVAKSSPWVRPRNWLAVKLCSNRLPIRDQSFSHTGVALAKLFGIEHRDTAGKVITIDPITLRGEKPIGKTEEAQAIIVRGARQHNLKGVDVEIPRDKMTVCCGLSGSGKSSLAMDTIYAKVSVAMSKA